MSDERGARFLVALRAAAAEGRGRRWLPLETVLRSFDRTFPALVGQPERLATIVELLDRLGDEGTLEVPRKRGSNGLPTRVTVTGPQPTAARAAVYDLGPLHPILAGVSSITGRRLSNEEASIVLRVNRFLVEEGGIGAEIVPVRERAWSLFGARAEKLLDAHRQPRSRLFRAGVTTDATLRTEAAPPPFAWQQVGPAGHVLFVENATPFHSLVRVLEGLPGPGPSTRWSHSRPGIIGFAAGTGFADRLLALPRVERQIGSPLDRLTYAGDLDKNGISIPAAAAIKAAAAGLPALTPEIPLYEAMIEVARAQPATAEPHELPEASADWLGPRLADAISALFERGVHLPQEAVGLEAMRRIYAPS